MEISFCLGMHYPMPCSNSLRMLDPSKKNFIRKIIFVNQSTK